MNMKNGTIHTLSSSSDHDDADPHSATPFSRNPIMLGYDSRLFQFHADLGYTFRNHQVVGREGFVSIDEAIQKCVADSEARVAVLNIGDSSTTGWNGNNLDQVCPLFTYSTYPDLLSSLHGICLINAGVPGYTTYQAKKYTHQLLKYCAQRSLYFDYVTFYLGNNDSCYNGAEDRVSIDFAVASNGNIYSRVSPEDFERNYAELVYIAHAYGAKPIILIPARNKKWPPGKRTLNELDQRKKLLQVTNGEVLSLHKISQALYSAGDLEGSYENDYLLPRIKNSYVDAIHKLIRRANLAYVDCNALVSSSDDFIDYCHPSEALNNRIADRIFRLLSFSPTPRSCIQATFPTTTSDMYSLY